MQQIPGVGGRAKQIPVAGLHNPWQCPPYTFLHFLILLLSYYPFSRLCLAADPPSDCARSESSVRNYEREQNIGNMYLNANMAINIGMDMG